MAEVSPIFANRGDAEAIMIEVGGAGKIRKLLMAGFAIGDRLEGVFFEIVRN
jgi:hypothetical protein